MKTNKFFRIDDDEISGNRLDCYFIEDFIYIQIENPWAGDSETGFGESASIRLSKDKASELVKNLHDFVVTKAADGVKEGVE